MLRKIVHCKFANYSYDNFQKNINDQLQFCNKKIREDKLDPNNNLVKNMMLFRLISDTLKLKPKGTERTITHLPIKYDLDDYKSEKNFDSHFVSKLINREILMSKMEKRAPRSLIGIDFMLGVHDSHRMGGLRFKDAVQGEFISNDQRLAAPPWTSLRELEYAVEQYEKNADELDQASLKWINQLIAPGSSLGGARPKADVVDANGKQWIAKFPGKK